MVNRREEAVIYEPGGAEVAHLRMESPLRYVSFRKRGTELVILTADQKVRTVDLRAAAGVAGQ